MARGLLGRTIPSILLLFIASSFVQAQTPSGITYHGKILRSDNSPLNTTNAFFKIEIRSPGSENCLLWQEEQTVDMSATEGVFVLNITDSSARGYSRTDGYAWDKNRVFSNRTGFTGLNDCDMGETTYSPSANDGRTIKVSFKESPAVATWEDIQISKLNYVPMSLNSQQLAGFSFTEFLKIEPGASQTPLTIAQVNTLLQVIAGTTTIFVKPGDTATGDLAGSFAAPVVDGLQGVPVLATAPALNQVLKFNGTAWAPATESMPGDASYAAKGAVQFLTDQATSGIQVAAGVVSLPNLHPQGSSIGSAQMIPVITFDTKGRLTAVSTATVDDTTKLPLAGGTMTGPLDMGSQNITNVNSVSTTSLGSRSLRLFDADNSNYVDLQTPTAVATNYALTLPADDGTAGQVLTTDGIGVLSWVDPFSLGEFPGNSAIITNSTGTGLIDFACPMNQVFSFDGLGIPTCQAVTPAGGFINNGNSFAANATLGINDAFDLNIETSGVPRMTVTAAGNVGIGTTNPMVSLDLSSKTDATRLPSGTTAQPQQLHPLVILDSILL
ncbi:MAG: hypothetical protein ACK5V3_15705 [Bdellovibrionales bacterium]